MIRDGPEQLNATVVDLDGNLIAENVLARRRDMPGRPYYDFRPVVDTPGFYTLVVDGGPETGASFEVVAPETVAVPIPGQPLPPFDTPTFDDPAGLVELCTLQPDCPFHEITLTEALTTGRPVAYFVGTPAFCRTGTCGPALEALVEIAPDYDEAVTFVHAEVYVDDAGTIPTPAVEAVAMFYEPALFLTDGTGTIVERLDSLWDLTELSEALDRAIAA